MAKQINVTTEINAPIEQAWKILSDTENWGSWNPLIIKIEGRIEVGRKVKFTIKIPNITTTTMEPVIQRRDEGRGFAWIGSLPIPNMFDGFHSFDLEPSNHGCRFIHAETFSGLSIPVIPGFFWRNLEQGYLDMNLAFKRQVESASQTS